MLLAPSQEKERPEKENRTFILEGFNKFETVVSE